MDEPITSMDLTDDQLLRVMAMNFVQHITMSGYNPPEIPPLLWDVYYFLADMEDDSGGGEGVPKPKLVNLNSKRKETTNERT